MTKSELLRIAKPILFNTDMVRAILDDRKAATRRVVKQSVWEDFVCERGKVIHYLDKKMGTLESPVCKAPYQIGDILYVRETWQEYASTTDETSYFFRADEVDCMIGEIDWRPSIHMPKEAARIFLKVKDVRVERLQDMETVDDRNYISEGAKDKHDFIHIWDATVKDKEKYEKYGWYANPWVWVIEFERIYPDDCLEVRKGNESFRNIVDE